MTVRFLRVAVGTLLAVSAAADARRDPPTTAESSRLTDPRWDVRPPTTRAAALLARAAALPYAPPPRYAMLVAARDAALQAGDATTAVAAVRALAAEFAVDGAALEFDALDAVAIRASMPTEFATLAKLAVGAVDRRLAASSSGADYAACDRLAAAAAAWARVSEDAGLALRVSAWGHRVQALCGQAAKVAPAFDALSADPTDAAAHLAVGRLLCFEQDDWGRGLPHLAQGSDAALAALARLEATGAADPSSWLPLGDGWWDAATDTDGIARWHVQRRACRWYAKALPQAAGPRRALIDRRAAEAGLSPHELLDLRD